jgi:hypothetical protein
VGGEAYCSVREKGYISTAWVNKNDAREEVAGERFADFPFRGGPWSGLAADGPAWKLRLKRAAVPAEKHMGASFSWYHKPSKSKNNGSCWPPYVQGVWEHGAGIENKMSMVHASVAE